MCGVFIGLFHKHAREADRLARVESTRKCEVCDGHTATIAVLFRGALLRRGKLQVLQTRIAAILSACTMARRATDKPRRIFRVDE